MKKRIKYLIILLFSLFLFENGALAKAEDERKICEYKDSYQCYKSKDDKLVSCSTDDEGYFSPFTLNQKIFYNLEKNQLFVAYDTIPGLTDNYSAIIKKEVKRWGKYYSLSDSKIFGSNSKLNDDASVAENGKSLINNFKCPDVVFSDDYDKLHVINTNGFSSSDVPYWLHMQVKTTFGRINEYAKVTKITKTYDINDEISNSIIKYYDDFYKNNFNEKEYCEKYKNGEINSSEYIEKMFNLFKEGVTSHIDVKYWGAGKLPSSLMEQPKAFKTIKTKLITSEASLKKSCQDSIKNDEKIDEETKEELIEKLDDVVDFESFNEYFDIQMDISSLDFDWSGGEDCDGFLGDPDTSGDPAYYLQLCLKIMKYAAIVLTLVLSSIDFFNAVTSQEKEQLTKATTNSAKRLAFTIIMFFLPVLINFILKLIGAYSTCNIG